MGRKLIAEGGQQVHLAHAGVSLGAADPQPPRCEVDVAPAKGEGLSDPRPGEREGGEQGPPGRCSPIAACFRVEPVRQLTRQSGTPTLARLAANSGRSGGGVC
jgi:hypothetical protein